MQLLLAPRRDRQRSVYLWQGEGPRPLQQRAPLRNCKQCHQRPLRCAWLAPRYLPHLWKASFESQDSRPAYFSVRLLRAVATKIQQGPRKETRRTIRLVCDTCPVPGALYWAVRLSDLRRLELLVRARFSCLLWQLGAARHNSQDGWRPKRLRWFRGRCDNLSNTPGFGANASARSERILEGDSRKSA